MAIPSSPGREQTPTYGGRAVFEVSAGPRTPGPAAQRPSEQMPDAAGRPAPATNQPTAAAGQPVIDDEWRRWLAENVLIDNSPESIVRAMISAGFPQQVAEQELRSAQESPYVRGGELLRNRLRKRDWILTVYRKINRLHPSSTQVERRHRLSRDEFFYEYYTTNRPVIITGMMDDWPAMHKWTLDYLSSTFGDHEVEVQMNRNTGEDGAAYEMNSERFSGRIEFAEFVRRLRSEGRTNDFYLTANNNSSNRGVLPELWQDVVQFPEYLREDPDGCFFWMGPAGTITPFHHDLTNNFMAQVMGRKRLKIVPSWDMPLMMNHRHVFSQIDGRVTPAAPAPEFTRPQILEFVLNPGEILFLPVGCMHFVEGLDITITITFTNFVFDNDFSSFYSSNCPL